MPTRSCFFRDDWPTGRRGPRRADAHGTGHARRPCIGWQRRGGRRGGFTTAGGISATTVAARAASAAATAYFGTRCTAGPRLPRPTRITASATTGILRARLRRLGSAPGNSWQGGGRCSSSSSAGVVFWPAQTARDKDRTQAVNALTSRQDDRHFFSFTRHSFKAFRAVRAFS